MWYVLWRFYFGSALNIAMTMSHVSFERVEVVNYRFVFLSCMNNVQEWKWKVPSCHAVTIFQSIFLPVILFIWYANEIEGLWNTNFNIHAFNVSYSVELFSWVLLSIIIFNGGWLQSDMNYLNYKFFVLTSI